jgi:hypothetical protein
MRLEESRPSSHHKMLGSLKPYQLMDVHDAGGTIPEGEFLVNLGWKIIQSIGRDLVATAAFGSTHVRKVLSTKRLDERSSARYPFT